MSDNVLQALLADDDSGSSLSVHQRQQLLDTVQTIGDVNDSCAECHITASQLMDALGQDPDLEQDLQMARGRFNADLRRRIIHLALNGYEVPMLGGKDKDEVVAMQTLPEPKALDIVSKMHFSKDMAQYTRSEVKTTDVSKRKKGDELNITENLTRAERSLLDGLLQKAAGVIEKSEEKA